MNQANMVLDLSENGYIPDIILRRGMRLLIKQRLKTINATNPELMAEDHYSFYRHMKASPVAIHAEKANEQHYEIPQAFFKYALGDHLKYSCCYWDDSTATLSQAEKLSLSKTCENADIKNGISILELGCGWGSLSLYMAENFPNSYITAVSNSHSQREYIITQAQHRELSNIEVITCDMNDFEPTKKYDRIVSVEMMEHMRNYQILYEKIARWLDDNGKFFKHIFVHRSTPYAFEVQDETDWMSQYFFSGGMMPSDDLPLWFQEQLKIEKRWRWSGIHYEKTANAWLYNMDNDRERIFPILEQTYGKNQAEKWWNRWRMFFMACAELFGYHQGDEWWVSHYLFSKKQTS